AFKINGITGVEWDGYSDLEADDILKSKRERKKKIDIALESAKLFLIDVLGDKKYEKRKVIMEMAAEAGISDATLNRAKNELGIIGHSIGYGKNKLAWWSMEDVKKEDLPHEPEQEKISDLSIS
ncbi:MAG: hypothetical protein PUD43_09150, partial [Clostridia bacterium]|nr:hypothetical protein [Clostridia bacterium]